MIETTNKTKADIDLDLVKKIVKLFLSTHKSHQKNVSVAFVSDAEIRALNKKYRQKDNTTDILSFCGEGEDLGELIISYSQIKRQAKEYSNSTKEELVFILVHGLFHLLGFTDETEEKAKKMDKLGEGFIEKYV